MTEDDKLYPSDTTFQMAFVIEDTNTGVLLDDPKFVKWFAIYVHGVEGKFTKRAVPMYPCTDDEFSKFYEPSKAYTDRYDGLRNSGSLMCIDWVKEDLTIYGTESSGNFGALDVVAAPCHMG